MSRTPCHKRIEIVHELSQGKVIVVFGCKTNERHYTMNSRIVYVRIWIDPIYLHRRGLFCNQDTTTFQKVFFLTDNRFGWNARQVPRQEIPRKELVR